MPAGSAGERTDFVQVDPEILPAALPGSPAVTGNRAPADKSRIKPETLSVLKSYLSHAVEAPSDSTGIHCLRHYRRLWRPSGSSGLAGSPWPSRLSREPREPRYASATTIIPITPRQPIHRRFPHVSSSGSVNHDSTPSGNLPYPMQEAGEGPGTGRGNLTSSDK